MSENPTEATSDNPADENSDAPAPEAPPAEEKTPEEEAEKKSARKKPGPAKKSAATKKKTESAPAAPDFSKGSVQTSELKVNTSDSDTVRRLQHRLGLEVTGNYDAQTMEAVRVWQNKAGYVGGRGRMMSEEQANRLFGKGYSVKA